MFANWSDVVYTQTEYVEWRYFALRILSNDVTETLELSVSIGDATGELEYESLDMELALTGRIKLLGRSITLYMYIEQQISYYSRLGSV